MENIRVEDCVSSAEFRDLKDIALYRGIPWDNLKGKRIFITGAAGFIAGYLSKALLLRDDMFGDGITVSGLVRDENKAAGRFGRLLDRDDLKLITGDVCEAFQVEADYIIHAASQASAMHFEKDPVGTIRANLIGTDNVLRAAQKTGAEVLLVSSLKVYGRVTDGTQTLKEKHIGMLDIDASANCYAMGKRTLETLGVCYAKQYGVKVRMVRPGYIYGAAPKGDDRVWAQFLNNVVDHKDILLKSDGLVYRSFCYVTDAVTAMLVVLLKGEEVTPYNIAGENGRATIRDFAMCAADSFPERKLKLVFEKREDAERIYVPSKDVTPEILDSARIESLGWKSQIDVFEGIRRSVETMESL